MQQHTPNLRHSPRACSVGGRADKPAGLCWLWPPASALSSLLLLGLLLLAGCNPSRELFLAGAWRVTQVRTEQVPLKDLDQAPVLEQQEHARLARRLQQLQQQLPGSRLELTLQQQWRWTSTPLEQTGPYKVQQDRLHLHGPDEEPGLGAWDIVTSLPHRLVLRQNLRLGSYNYQLTLRLRPV